MSESQPLNVRITTFKWTFYTMDEVVHKLLHL